MTSDTWRLEQILDPSFVAGAITSPTTDLRARLRAARGIEDQLSYGRRLAQARIDILQAELDRRAAGEHAPATDIVGHLTSVLGGGPSGGRGAHSPLGGTVPGEQSLLVEELLPSADLTRIPDLPTREVEELREQLLEREGHASGLRRQIHEVIDALEAELVRRYRDDAAPGQAGGAPGMSKKD